ALINSFRRLGLDPLTLGPADPRRMGAELPEWGSYYEAGPLVIAGEIPGGDRALAGAGRYFQPEREEPARVRCL
ncbi:MAG: thermostable hemolysin, partial [Thauera sp.]